MPGLTDLTPSVPSACIREVTRACASPLSPLFGATAVPNASPQELSNAEGSASSQLGVAQTLLHVVLTGGDTLKRAILFELIHDGPSNRFSVSVQRSAAADGRRNQATARAQASRPSRSPRRSSTNDMTRSADCPDPRADARGRACVANARLLVSGRPLACLETADDLPAIHGRSRDRHYPMDLYFLVSVEHRQALAQICC